MAEPVKFRGIVTYQRYYNEDSFYGVFNVRIKEKIPFSEEITQPSIFEDDKDFEPYYIVCVAGKMQQLYVGSEYEFNATCEYNSRYKSWNYVPISVTSIAPKTIEETRFFLSSIINENQVDVLLGVYPNIVQEIMDGTDNVDVKKLYGIGDTTYKKIKQKILDNYVISDIITMLQPCGVSYTQIKNLLKWESNSSILKQKIKDNPYCLTEANGFGFQTVDRYALKYDPTLINSGKRLIAFMKFFLNQRAENEGDTWVELSQLKTGIINQIPQCTDIFDKLVGLDKDGEFGGYFYINNNRIGLARYHSCEENIYSILKEMEQYKFLDKIDVENGIAKAEKQLRYVLTEEQRDVVGRINDSNVILFTGPAGTGKSTVGRAILNSFPNSSIACCSLSAKAAQRVQEATGFKAMTIHRLLGYSPMGFTYTSKNRMPYDVIFLDEASMVNCVLFYYLVSAIKEGAKLIICGDYAQLPPIGAGNVFADLLHMKNCFNVSILNKVHRQAEISGILTDANKIREGIFPIEDPTVHPQKQILNGELRDMAYLFRDSKERIQDIVVDQFMKIKNKHGLDSVAIAVPRKDKVINSALEINKQIQFNIIDTENTPFIQGYANKFYIGDRILQTENDGSRDIYNGEVGYVEKVFPNAKGDEVCMVARFKSTLNGKDKIIEYDKEDLGSVLLGYAFTSHKLQGSEYDYILVALDSTHFTLLDRCMLYTAITRAKKMCILVSQPEAFKHAMRTNKVNNRQTWLSLKYTEPDKEDDDL